MILPFFTAGFADKTNKSLHLICFSPRFFHDTPNVTRYVDGDACKVSENRPVFSKALFLCGLEMLQFRAGKCIWLGWRRCARWVFMQYRERFSANVSLSSLPEGILVELAQQGNQAAFQELIVRVRESCVRMATAILRNRDDAEEEVQNALCRAYTHLPLFNHQSTFATWVTRIVINHCFMRYRRARRLRFVSYETTGSDGESYAAYEPTGADTPEAGLGRDQVRQVLRQELRYIPSLLRVPLEMRFLQGRSIDDVAGSLGISVAAAKSRLHRAQGYLRDRMSRHCGRRGAATLMHIN